MPAHLRVLVYLALLVSACSLLGPRIDCGDFNQRDCATVVSMAIPAAPPDRGQPKEVIVEGGPTPSCPGGGCDYLSANVTITFYAGSPVTIALFGWTRDEVQVRAVTDAPN